MFTDQAKITVQGGNGGNGCTAWRREKYIDKGGPSGGNGGTGGSIYMIAENNTDTLSNYASTKHHKAESGLAGQGSNCAGKAGEDLYLPVPPGTLVYEIVNSEKKLLADLAINGQTCLLASGGRGGFGNAHFKSSVRQRPDFAELGEAGEKKEIHLELKLVADIGIIGFPSVGKSSLIAAISSAKPKIAAYEFTTLVPNLGVVDVFERSFVVCDVPGLIEGAADGKGLGDLFLKHIERCGTLLHMVDISKGYTPEGFSVSNITQSYKVIRSELQKYSVLLSEKKELVVLNKIDVFSEHLPDIRAAFAEIGIPIFAEISVSTMQGVSELVRALYAVVEKERIATTELQDAMVAANQDEMVVLKPADLPKAMSAFTIDELPDRIQVSGKRLEQFTNMTNFDSAGSMKRWRSVIQSIKLKRAIKKYGNKPVFIGKVQVDDFM